MLADDCQAARKPSGIQSFLDCSPGSTCLAPFSLERGVLEHGLHEHHVVLRLPGTLPGCRVVAVQNRLVRAAQCISDVFNPSPLLAVIGLVRIGELGGQEA